MKVSTVHPLTVSLHSCSSYWFASVLLLSPKVSVLRLFFISTLRAAGWDFFKTAGTWGGNEGSRCRPRKESKRRHIRPLPRNIIPVTSQKILGSSSRDDSKFIPNATPMSPKSEREKVPIVSCKFSLIITLRWLKKEEISVRGIQKLPAAKILKFHHVSKINNKKTCWN